MAMPPTVAIKYCDSDKVTYLRQGYGVEAPNRWANIGFLAKIVLFCHVFFYEIHLQIVLRLSENIHNYYQF